jgi:hypothetical protein
MATASRLIAAVAEHVLGSRPPRQSCFTATESGPTGVERLTEPVHMSKRTFYQHFSSKNDLVEEYLAPHPPRRRDAQRAGDRHRRRLAAQPHTGPLDSPPGAVSGVHFITPPSRQVRNVNHSVCLMA